MTDKKKIRAEIERQYEAFKAEYARTKGAYVAGRMDALDYIAQFIDSLPEEKPSKDLEEAAEEYAYSWRKEGNKVVQEIFPKAAYRAFFAGAEWQKRKMMERAVGVEVVGEKRDLRLIDSTQRCLFDARRGDWLKVIILPNE